MDREKVVKGLELCASGSECIGRDCPYWHNVLDDVIKGCDCTTELIRDALALLKEQEKKEIKLHKKHVITWKRDDEFTMRKLYEAVCETLMDEGELVIVRIDDHEKVDFTFYVTHEDNFIEGKI